MSLADVTQAAEQTIPFERQERASAERMCGAAALCMVYRSFGGGGSQWRVWERIARPDCRGKRAARTSLLAVNSLHHGLSAMVVEASDPWQTLVRCATGGVRVVLNHRLDLDSPLGHYTVLVEAGEQHVVVHDPQFGPNRRLTRSELLELWRPANGSCEIVGHILVAIARPDEASAGCELCGTPVPESIFCPGCRSAIPLRPTAALGCVQRDCPARTWRHLFCPYCDRRMSDVVDPEESSVDFPETAHDVLREHRVANQ